MKSSIIVVFTFILNFTYAQQDRLSLPALKFRIYTSEDGLTDNSVYDVFQDSKGFIWLATDAGANRFNGYSFEQFKIDKSAESSLSGNVVSSFCEDNEGFIWISNRNKGIDRYNPRDGSFLYFEYDENYAGSISTSFGAHVTYDSIKNYIILSTNKGLNILDLNTNYEDNYFFHKIFTDTEGADALATDNIKYVIVDRQGLYWVVTQGNFYQLNIESLDPFKFNLVRFDSEFSNELDIDNEGNLWYTTSVLNKVTYDEDAGTYHTSAFNIVTPNNEPFNASGGINFSIDLNGNCWLANINGLYAIEISDDGRAVVRSR